MDGCRITAIHLGASGFHGPIRRRASLMILRLRIVQKLGSRLKHLPRAVDNRRFSNHGSPFGRQLPLRCHLKRFRYVLTLVSHQHIQTLALHASGPTLEAKSSFDHAVTSKVRNIPTADQFGWYTGRHTEAVLLNMKSCRSGWDFRFGWRLRNKHEELVSITEIARYFHLPLDESFPRVKSEYNSHILADDSDCVGLLVKRETRLDAKELLKRE